MCFIGFCLAAHGNSFWIGWISVTLAMHSVVSFLCMLYKILKSDWNGSIFYSNNISWKILFVCNGLQNICSVPHTHEQRCHRSTIQQIVTRPTFTVHMPCITKHIIHSFLKVCNQLTDLDWNNGGIELGVLDIHFVNMMSSFNQLQITVQLLFICSRLCGLISSPNISIIFYGKQSKQFQSTIWLCWNKCLHVATFTFIFIIFFFLVLSSGSWLFVCWFFSLKFYVIHVTFMGYETCIFFNFLLVNGQFQFDFDFRNSSVFPILWCRAVKCRFLSTRFKHRIVIYCQPNRHTEQ